MASEWAARCPDDDWPADGGMDVAVMADCGRAILRAALAGEVNPE